ncbi:hypothetical protein [Streptomyces sp. NPDC001480]|uniref:hypothetical protein n=1 Tax=Streptomyces sp. NPDC001480 TaxID=3364577 RepID=UPI003686C2C0
MDDMSSLIPILEEEPLPAHEVLAELALMSENDTRGTGGDDIVGQISLGYPQVAPLALPDDASQGLPDPSAWDVVWVRWPYTVHEPAEGFLHTRVKVSFTLGDNQSRAMGLSPKDVTAEETVSRTYGLTPMLTFGVVELGADLFTHQVSFSRLTPLITAFGEGESTFFWVYRSAAGQPVRPGTKHSIAVLQIPVGRGHLDVTVGAEVELRRRWLGRWRPGRAASDIHGARLTLPAAGTASAGE